MLLSVARGKVSEGIDFDHNYGRAVIMFGCVSKLQDLHKCDPRGSDGTDHVYLVFHISIRRVEFSRRASSTYATYIEFASRSS